MFRSIASQAGLIALTLAAAAPAVAAQTMTLENYLDQVRSRDPGFRGATQAFTASEETTRKADLYFRPQFFVQLQFIDDTRTTQAPAIQGTSTIKRNASVGVRDQTPWGLGVQVSFDVNQSTLFNIDPALVARPDLLNTYLDAQVSLSLWQNFLGRADKANYRLTKAQELATAYGKDYESRATLVRAEGAYWKLAVAREATRVQRASAERAQRLLAADSRQARAHLRDPSELLLARSAVKGKELELRAALEEERSAARELNLARGTDSEEVKEELRLPDAHALLTAKAVAHEGMRGDVKAAEQAEIAQVAGAELAREKLLPDLVLYGSVYAWGLNFTAPLDAWTTSAVREGYARQESAAELSLERKRLEQDSDRKDLERRYDDARQRLQLALELEEIQKEKFENVRARRARGLTVIDQVFSYELDYLNASLNRVRIEGMILGIGTQLKLFESGGNAE